ncbi:MAG: MmgE/PrpD family protein [Pseudomonadota bacterium]
MTTPTSQTALPTASQRLAAFAAGLRLEDVPQEVLVAARTCIADTIACGVYGASSDVVRPVREYATRYGAGGAAHLFAADAVPLHAPFAALVNGAAVHAYEQDSLRFPGAGVHPGAALVPTIAAACEETGATGATALRAFVAGCEVLFRIGAASHHSSEKLGFHAPGLTGVYAGAVAAGVVYGLDAAAIARAMGIAGSMSAGLLAFTKSAEGGMVKRLHIGRAAEAGIVAARLAQAGAAGPETVLDGRFGFLEVYCRDGEEALLTAGLGEQWETLKICLKRYACHVTAQAPVQAVRALMQEHGLSSQHVAAIALEVPAKVLSHHDIRAPGDAMQAQYSVPFCVALATLRDLAQPSAFDAEALAHPHVLALCAGMQMGAGEALPTAWSSRVRLTLADGRTLARDAYTYQGMPQEPCAPEQLRERFLARCESLHSSRAQSLWRQLADLEHQTIFPLPHAA